MLFYRKSLDGTRWDASPALRGSCIGTLRNTCWIIGAGPSFREIPHVLLDRISRSPAARFAVNYGGFIDGQGWLLKPTHWTTYDKTVQFSPSLILDPSVMKFIKESRSVEQVPGTPTKVCEAPNTYCFQHQPRKYHNFCDLKAETILDCKDSLIQAMDIAIQLGYRRLCLIGTDLVVRPSLEQQNHFGVSTLNLRKDGQPCDLLTEWVAAVRQKTGKQHKQVLDEMQTLGREAQYGAAVSKDTAAALRMDTHYFNTVQYLRQSRPTMVEHGVEVVNCTLGSRLDPWFPYTDPESILDDLERTIGCDRLESTVGHYARDFSVGHWPYHKDIPPYVRSLSTTQEVSSVKTVHPVAAWAKQAKATAVSG